MSFVYNIAKFRIMSGVMFPDADTFKVMLMSGTPTYVADPDHTFLSGSGPTFPVHDELSGFGYTRKEFSGSALIQNDAADRTEWDARDAIWPGINAGVTSAAIIFKDTGDEATSPLVAYVNSGGFPVETTGGDLTIRWSSSGVILLT